MRTEVAVDETGTPASVRRALAVVARHGYLTPEKLAALEADEWDAVQNCIREFKPTLFVQIANTHAGGDRVGFATALGALCGVLNLWFDQEATSNLHALPEEERERVRALPVNAETWRQLRVRSRWHMVRPRRRSSAAPRMRHGRPMRHVRRRRVASSPRRSRAPSRLADDDEPDDLVALPAGSAA